MLDYYMHTWLFTPFHSQVDSYYDEYIEKKQTTDIHKAGLLDPIAHNIYNKLEIICDVTIPDYNIAEIDPKFIPKVICEILHDDHTLTAVMSDILSLTSMTVKFRAIHAMYENFRKHRYGTIKELQHERTLHGIGFRPDTIDVPYQFEEFRDRYIMYETSEYEYREEFEIEVYY